MSYINDIGQVVYSEESSQDPNWWRNYEMTPEQIEQYKQHWHRHWQTETGFDRLIADGGGFSGHGISGAEALSWPRRVIVYVPPLKGYWSEAGKQEMLKKVDQICENIKQEIRDA
jgi:hypothetical protein